MYFNTKINIFYAFQLVTSMFAITDNLLRETRISILLVFYSSRPNNKYKLKKTY